MGGEYYLVIFPAEKKAYHTRKDELDSLVDTLCEKLFRNGYLEREGEERTPTRLTALDYARTLAHYAGVSDMEKEGVAELVFFPLLEECDCSPTTKEFFLLLLAKYITGEITPQEMVKTALTRFLKVTEKLKVHEVRFY